MPLRQGATTTVISRNVEEMLRKFRSTGKIGLVTPRNLAHARKIATAAAYRKAKHG